MSVASGSLPNCSGGGTEVGRRIDREQARIDQGVESGQLTYKEYGRVEGRLDKIDAAYQHDLAENGGHLTPQEAKQLNHQEDGLSKLIYFDKHNLAHQPGAKSLSGTPQPAGPASGCGGGTEAGRRVDREQARIDRGVESGQLTWKEYDQVQTRLDKIDSEYEHDLKEHGGHLTPQESRQINRQEDSLSDLIYFDKHNLAHQPGAKTV